MNPKINAQQLTNVLLLLGLDVEAVTGCAYPGFVLG